MNNKGLVVTTYNSEKWFEGLYNTIPLDSLQEVVVVNGGDSYTKKYDGLHWIQHKKNYGAAQARIDGIKYLLQKNIEHIFVVEDDMLFIDKNVFDSYTEASLETGLKYFCFCSNAAGNGIPGKRTPAETVQYNNHTIAFYREMNNEFTYYRSEVFNKIGFYDCSFTHLWDVEYVYRVLTDKEIGCGFRYFPDLVNSDKFIMNHPESINNSRTNINNRRDRELPLYLTKFQQKHGYAIQTVPILEKQQFISKLKYLHKTK